jgi:hypothetical protein
VNKAWFSRASRWLLTVVALALMWFGFVKLGLHIDPEFELAPTVSMLWLTFAALVVVSFPEVVKYVKSIKVAGVEIELTAAIESLSESAVAEQVEPSGGETTGKGAVEPLRRAVETLRLFPSRPMLLNVPLKWEPWLRSDMLFAYLTVLNLYTDRLLVAFQAESDLLAMSGSQALRLLSIAQPHLIPGLAERPAQEGNDEFRFRTWLAALTGIGRTSLSDSDIVIDEIWRAVTTSPGSLNDWSLSRTDVERIFGGQGSRVVLRFPLQKHDISLLRGAILDGKEVVIISRDNGSIAVVPTCEITAKLSARVLRALTEK